MNRSLARGVGLLDQEDVRPGRQGVGPLDVERDLDPPPPSPAFAGRFDEPFCGHDPERRRVGQAELLVEGVEVGLDVRLVVGVDDRDRLPRAVPLHATGESDRVEAVGVRDLARSKPDGLGHVRRAGGLLDRLDRDDRQEGGARHRGGEQGAAFEGLDGRPGGAATASAGGRSYGASAQHVPHRCSSRRSEVNRRIPPDVGEGRDGPYRRSGRRTNRDITCGSRRHAVMTNSWASVARPDTYGIDSRCARRPLGPTRHYRYNGTPIHSNHLSLNQLGGHQPAGRTRPRGRFPL